MKGICVLIVGFFWKAGLISVQFTDAAAVVGDK